MRLAFEEIVINPQKPCMQCGYVQRDHPYESIHDDVKAVVYVLTLDNQKMAWVSVDSVGLGETLLSRLNKAAKARGLELNDDNFIIGVSHDHSAPAMGMIIADRDESDPEYLDYLSELLADSIKRCWKAEGSEVWPRYSSLTVDGIYSNRNDANKLSDKIVHLIGFFDREENLKALFCQLSCHNTVLGPRNYALTGELFGALRDRLSKYFHCQVFMANGNSGDMGNRQYRTGQDFPDLELMADNLAEQIERKRSIWQPFEMNRVTRRHVEYSEDVTFNSQQWIDKIADFQKRLEHTDDLTERKVLLSGIEGFRYKQSLGDGTRKIEMRADVYDFDELQIISVPGELGSILGLKAKAASPKKFCILWGYTGNLNLGYMVDEEAYTMECQETNTTVYPKGMPERFVDAIIKAEKQ
ncbi:MAG: hypothetical protein J5694_03900 [Erysipelotrichaceae bacterium]|nr:hypothetical protein [Erysipelotrichaceae bacterium]